jgi:intracellular sulfur oxidation DsrE/DsrF family protein
METNELRIDIPVKLAEVKNVFSIASLSFEGDLPAALFHLKLLMDDVDAWNATAQVVAVFHTNAGHVTLRDHTGNPYKALLASLMNRGIQIELCGATAQAHGWTNADTLKGIQINTDAMARTTELVQQGFVKISEA